MSDWQYWSLKVFVLFAGLLALLGLLASGLIGILGNGSAISGGDYSLGFLLLLGAIVASQAWLLAVGFLAVWRGVDRWSVSMLERNLDSDHP